MPLSEDLRLLTQTPTFLSASPEMKRSILEGTRDEFIQENPNLADYANQEAESAQVSYLRNTGQGRYIPENLEFKAPWQSEDFSYLTEEEKTNEIEKFRQGIPQIASQDKLNQGDTEFYLNQVADAALRQAKGEDTGWVMDKAYRTFDGFAAGLASYVGADGIADSIRKSTSENPEYDRDFMANLFQGAGDMLASTTIFLGATLGGTALTGNPAAGAYIGSAATLGSNSIMRYNDNYRKAIELGYNDEQAHEAGINALPGAAIDAVGDKLIAGKFLPNSMTATFARGTLQEKQALLANLIKDKSTRGMVLNTARDAFVEGTTEVLGDYASGYGGYLTTQDKEFLPKSEELTTSFAIGALLGGGVSIATEIPGIVRNDKTTLEGVQTEVERINDPSVETDEVAADKIYSLLNEGKYKEALAFSREVITKPAVIEEPTININPDGEAAPTVEAQEQQQIPVSQFIPTNENEDQTKVDPADLAPAKDRVESELKKEKIEYKRMTQIPPDAKAEFESSIDTQFDIYGYDEDALESELRSGVSGETSAPVRGLRVGVAETSDSISTTSEEFARALSARYTNVDLVQPGEQSRPGVKADFTLRGRDNPEGDVNVQPSPNIQTKIQEELARGRGDKITSIFPVNKEDQQFLNNNKVEEININSIEGVTVGEFDNGESWATLSEQGADNLADELDAKYGVDEWVMKDSLGAAGEGVLQFRASLKKRAKDANNEMDLNGWYAEPYNPNIDLNNRKEGTDQRVHIVKRGGQMEVVPYGTHNRMNPIPYVVRTADVRAIEQAALIEAQKVADQVPENALFGVDVVIGADGSLEVTELNPTQYGETSVNFDTGGASGYLGSAYIQSAIYSHIKGRVPAFAMAGRHIIREKLYQQRLAQGGVQIANRVARMVGNAKDEAVLRRELALTYGEQFADHTKEIWNAFTESLGLVTQKIVDLINRIIRSIFTPNKPFTPRPVNKQINATNAANQQINQQTAKQTTATNSKNEQSDPSTININFGKNQTRFNIPGAHRRSAAPLFDLQVLSESQPGFKSRRMLVMMPVDDFLNLAEKVNFGNQSSKKKIEDIKNLISNKEKLNEIPFLNTHRGQVTGHEGRHRAQAFKELGYTHMPVVLNDSVIRWSQQDDTNNLDYIDNWPETLTNEDGNQTYRWPIPRSAYEDYMNGGMRFYSIQSTTDLTEDIVKNDIASILDGELGPNIKVINDPSVPWAGVNSRRYSITINIANIESLEDAREVFMEEAIHSVWNDSEIQDAWNEIKKEVTQRDIDRIKVNYAKSGVQLTNAAAIEEVANALVRKRYKELNGRVRDFVNTLWNKLKEVFGLNEPIDQDAASRIVHRALAYQKEIKETRNKAAHPVNTHNFDNGQVAGPGRFYITAGHSTKGRFNPDDTNQLGRFDHGFMSTGEGQQIYGWGSYFWTNTGTRDSYLKQFDTGFGGVTDINKEEARSLLREKGVLFMHPDDFNERIIQNTTPYFDLNTDEGLERYDRLSRSERESFADKERIAKDVIFNKMPLWFDTMKAVRMGYNPVDLIGRILTLNAIHSPYMESDFKEWIFQDIISSGHLDDAANRVSQEANRAIQNFLAIRPNYSLDEYVYTPEMIKSYIEDFSSTEGPLFGQTSKSFQVRLNVQDNQLLDWDNIAEDNDYVFEKLNTIIKDTNPIFDNTSISDIVYPIQGLYGSDLYRKLSSMLGPKGASDALYSVGIKGIKFLDGWSRSEGEGTYNYVMFNDADIEIMSVEQDAADFDLTTPGELVRYDTERYNIPNVSKKSKKKRLKQLLDIKKLKVNDRFDSNTNELSKVVRRIRPSEVKYLSQAEQDRFWTLIDNIHQARVENTQNPQLRFDYRKTIDELRQYHDIIDAAAMQEMLKKYDHLDLSSLEKLVEDGDRDGFTEALNQLLEADADFQEKKKSKSKKDKERYSKKLEEWRKTFNNAKEDIKAAYPTAEDYITAFEETEGSSIKGANLRKFLMMHYDYLTEIADVEEMEGKELFRHTFAINNLLDGQFMYGAQTTAKYLAGLKNSQININSLKKKFRDPIINQGRGVVGGLDLAQSKTEVAQTRLERWSAFVDAKEWLQNDLMGDFLQSITLEAQNNEQASLKQYQTLKDEFQKEIGRDMNSEDRVVMSLVSRLIQYKIGQDGNKSFIDNLKNEWKAIENIVGKNGEDGAGTASQQSDYTKVIIPILQKLTIGLEESTKPLEDFLININSRIGLGDEKVGQARRNLLRGMQDIMDGYYLDNKVVSESFHNKPFTGYINYLPRLVVPINPEQFNARNSELDAEVESFDSMQYNTTSLLSEPSQIKQRVGIGNNAHYSNNIEYIFARGIHVSSLTSATTPSRFVLNQQLKSDTIRNLINGSNSTYRVDQLQQWARNLMLHAMHSGQPLGTIGEWMKVLNENYARVALSGIHQGITQTASGYTDYHVRTGNIAGAMNAAGYYIQNREKCNKWFEDNAAWIAQRSYLGEQELDRRRAPSFDENKILNSPIVQKLKKYHHKAGEIITFSLRHGDDFTTKSLVMAEYARLVQRKYGSDKNSKQTSHRSMHEIMNGVVEGNILSQAILNIEQNVNASNKVTRGEFFVDRHKGMSMIRNITVAFSSHVMMLAGQFNIAARDLIDLHNQGGSSADKIRAIRTMGAILSQSFVFSSARYVINGGLALGMIQMLRELFDDEEGKIASLEQRVQYAKDIGNEVMQEHAENELKAAIAIRRQIDTFSQRQTSFSSYWKNAVKDELGSIHFLFNGPQLPQKVIFPVFDMWGEAIVKEDNEARVKKMKDKIKKLKEVGEYRKASKLSEDLVLLENAEYLPWHIPTHDNIGLGGMTGTALDGVYSSWKEVVGAMKGVNEININDFILSAQSVGMGQADMNRFFKVIDKIEDEQISNEKDRQKRRKERQDALRQERAEQEAAIEEARLLREIEQ